MGEQGKRGPRPGASDVKTQILQTTLECLKERGYGGTTTREIARRGGFNSSLVFYYFGSLNGLLLAALDWNSARRRDRYAQLLDGAADPAGFAAAALQIYREDLEGGHITVFTELAAAALVHPDLAEALADRTNPWVDLLEGAFSRFLKDSPFAEVVASEELASAAVALYMGVNLLTRLDPQGVHATRVFDMAERLTPLLMAMSGGD